MKIFAFSLFGVSFIFFVIVLYLWKFKKGIFSLKEENTFVDESKYYEDYYVFANGILFYVYSKPLMRRLGDAVLRRHIKSKDRVIVELGDGEIIPIKHIIRRGKNTLVFLSDKMKRYVFFFY